MKHLHEIVLTCLLIGLLAVAAWLMPNFVNLKSQLFLSKHLWETAILAVAMTPIIITGGIDLSVGSTMGMCAVAFGICFEATNSLWLSTGACIAIGVLGGALNGWLVAKWEVHPLIITLATYAGYRGIAEGISQGRSYSQFGEVWGQLARGALWQIPLPAFLFAGMAIMAAIFLAKTPTGRFIYAIGHNEQAARFSGVPVARIKLGLYTLAGFLASIATLVYISRFRYREGGCGNGNRAGRDHGGHHRWHEHLRRSRKSLRNLHRAPTHS